MANSDVYAFSGVVTYMIAVTFLVGLSPFGQDTSFHNFLVTPSNTTANPTNQGYGTVLKIGSGIACVGTVAVAAALTFFTEGALLGSFSLAATSCGTFVTTLVAPANITDGIATLIFGVFAFLFIFFELLTFQLPIPAIINGLIILPAAAPLMYMGVKVLRGSG